MGAAAGVGLAGNAWASLARPVALKDLVAQSRHVLLATALEAHGEWATVGDTRRIVTFTRVRADELLAGQAPEANELLVRTLGGHVGDIGQIVHGEAALRLNEACVLFLRREVPEYELVSEMAQGHYPLRADAAGVLRLSASPRLGELVGAGSAAERLIGRRIDEARDLIRGVRP